MPPIILLLQQITRYLVVFSGYRYPSLRVAYVDELEERIQDDLNPSKKTITTYYSALAKAALPTSTNSKEPVQNLDQVILLVHQC